MDWLFLSLLAAISLATADALTKRFFSALVPYEMGLVRLFYALPWLLLALFFVPGAKPDRTFWLALVLSLPLETLAVFCYMKALKVSPLSLSLPFLAFTPAFVIVTGWILLGEKLTVAGLTGLVFVVAGSYTLNLSQIQKGWAGPLKAIGREPGSRLMLLVSLIYAFTSTLGKLAIRHSNPYFFGISYFLSLTLILLSLFPVVPGARAGHLIIKPRAGLLLGAVQALMIFSHMLAISKIQVAYMLSVKRTSLLFGVLYGALWFKEEKIKERLLGAGIMALGVLLIGWAV
jgi:drug/metabolite transporter (DMT)-like permease